MEAWPLPARTKTIRTSKLGGRNEPPGLDWGQPVVPGKSESARTYLPIHVFSVIEAGIDGASLQ